MRISDWSSDVCSSVLIAALAPVGLLIRYAILTPLSLVVPGLRKTVVERYSALAINPRFRRRAPEGEAKRLWHRTEAAASVWAIALIALVATGVIPLPAFAIVLAIARSEEHTSELQSLMRISYAVFCLKKKKTRHRKTK